ncbi:MAG: helix-turn-helix domain-containing protein [Butyrivibrio sp.]
MTLGDKLTKLRKENNYTQEQLAEIMEVSRQSISKWESDLAYPETDKLIKLARLFNCSTDYLLKDDNENAYNTNVPNPDESPKKSRFKRQSDKMVKGIPLWQIGKNAHAIFAVGLNARGIVAVGLAARGILSFGLASLGVFSFGLLSLGLISIGLLSVGGLSFGSLSAGIVSFGAVSFGIVAVGAFAVGQFSVGAFAVGNYAALGDVAKAQIALGDSEAVGSIYSATHKLSVSEAASVKKMLDENVPAVLGWAKAIFKMFL